MPTVGCGVAASSNALAGGVVGCRAPLMLMAGGISPLLRGGLLCVCGVVVG